MSPTSSKNEWYYSTHGKDYGPVSWSIIESMVQDDRLSRDDLVLQVGDSVYLPIDEVLHRLSVLSGRRYPQAVAEVANSDAETGSWPILPSATVDLAQPVNSSENWPELSELAQVTRVSKAERPDPVRESTTAIPNNQSTPASDRGQVAIAPPSGSTRRFTPVVEVIQTDTELALNPQRLMFGLQVSVIWAICCAMLFVLGSQMGANFLPLTAFFVLCVSLISYTVLAATVSHMLGIELKTGNCPAVQQGWDFAIARASPLILSPLLIGCSVGAVGALAGTIVYNLSGLRVSGSFSLGEILFLPTFIVLLIAILAIMSACQIPIIMGLKDCDPSEAVKIWRDHRRRRPFQSFLDLIRVLSRLAPILLLSLVIVGGGMTGAMLLTQRVYRIAGLQFDVATFFHVVSCCVICAIWLTFALALIVTSLATLIYNMPGEEAK